jgi:hypothetical protein
LPFFMVFFWQGEQGIVSALHAVMDVRVMEPNG